MSILETAQDKQGAYVYFTPAREATPAPYVAVVGAQSTRVHGLHVDAFVDRADAVKLRDALDEAIKAHDAREAEKARKLKRGDRVHGVNPDNRYTVISDEAENGRVDVVSLRTGTILTRRIASRFTRLPVPDSVPFD